MNFCSKHQFGGDTCFTCHIEKIADLERKLAEETKAREYAELTRGEFRESFQMGVEKIAELEVTLARAIALARLADHPQFGLDQNHVEELLEMTKELNAKS